MFTEAFKLLFKRNKDITDYGILYAAFFNLINFFHYTVSYDPNCKPFLKVTLTRVNILTLMIFILFVIFLLRYTLIHHYSFTYIEFIEIGNIIFTVAGFFFQFFGSTIELFNYKKHAIFVNSIYNIDVRVSFFYLF